MIYSRPVFKNGLVIRDPYASRHPTSLRLTEEEKRQRLLKFTKPSSSLKKDYHSGNSANNGNGPASGPGNNCGPNAESIYTILIKLPPPTKAPPTGEKSSINCQKASPYSTSIQQLPSAGSEPGNALVSVMKRSDSEHVRKPCRKGIENSAHRTVPTTPLIEKKSGTTPSATVTPSVTKMDEISPLPLDAKLVPKQLLKGVAPEHSSTGASSHPSLATTALAISNVTKKGGGKTVKKSTEKKQERKAAKTLSAILLAFILTWLPYSVLTILNSILGKEDAAIWIPNTVWVVSYYLCYINSTINPLLYALCNASFRRTYIRILTCRFAARQPVNRYYYG